jgi:Mor family transcriptional regulator
MKTKVAVDTSYRKNMSSQLIFQEFKARIVVDVSKEFKCSSVQIGSVQYNMSCLFTSNVLTKG